MSVMDDPWDDLPADDDELAREEDRRLKWTDLGATDEGIEQSVDLDLETGLVTHTVIERHYYTTPPGTPLRRPTEEETSDE